MQHHQQSSAGSNKYPEKRIGKKRTRWFSILLSAVGLILAGGFLTPHLVRSSKNVDLVEAISNAKQIGIALQEFEATYGSFPSESTIAPLKKTNATATALMGITSANDFFRQLIIDGEPSWEVLFYAKAPWMRRPDMLVAGTSALERGECAFSYITGASSLANPDRPVAVFPLVKGKKKFDYRLCRKYYYGKAIVLTADTAVRTYPVDESGRVLIDGRDFFDPAQPFWHGRVPEVKWPEQ